MSCKSSDKCPPKSEAEGDLRDRCGGNVTTEAVIGLMWLQMKECSRPPATPQAAKDDFSPRASRGSAVLPRTENTWLLSSATKFVVILTAATGNWI